MKKVALMLVYLLALTSVAFASPLTDYSEGKIAIDVNLFPNLDMKAKHSDSVYPVETRSIDGNLDYGITAGLGNNWAIQYRYFSPEGEGYSYIGLSNKTENQDINLLYKLNSNLSCNFPWY